MLALFLVGEGKEAAKVRVRAIDQVARHTVIDHEVEADVFLRVAKLARQALTRTVLTGQEGAEIEDRDHLVGELSGE